MRQMSLVKFIAMTACIAWVANAQPIALPATVGAGKSPLNFAGRCPSSGSNPPGTPEVAVAATGADCFLWSISLPGDGRGTDPFISLRTLPRAARLAICSGRE